MEGRTVLVVFFFFPKFHLELLTSLPIQLYAVSNSLSLLPFFKSKQQKTYKRNKNAFVQINKSNQTNPIHTCKINMESVLCSLLTPEPGEYPGLFLIQSVRIFWKGVIVFSSESCLGNRKLLG